MLSRLAAWCFSLALCLVVGGCGDKRSSVERATEQGLLIVGNGQEPVSLDPHKATAVADGKIITALLEGLVRPDPKDDTGVLPGMAESWERNEDATVWTFRLYEARWSDGRPVTAQDFAYAFRRMLHPSFGGKYAEMLYPLKNAERFNKGECPWEDVGVQTPDARTLVLTMGGPMPHLLPLLLHFTWCPLPAHHVEAMGGMLDRRSLWTKPENWVGNGAYVLAQHEYNNFLEVRANPLYHRAAQVRNKGVRFLPTVNGYTETRMFFDGKLHITNNVPPEMAAWAAQKAPTEFCNDAYYSTVFYRLNTARPPLNDPRVRRALSLALDREALVRDVVRGVGSPSFAFTPPVSGYAPVVPGWSHGTQEQHLAEARRLLAEAGFPDGRGFPVLELMTTSRDVQRILAECVQAMWKQNLGINVDIRANEWTAYKAAQRSGQYDISASNWSGDYPDPATFVELWRTGGGNNCTAWGDADCDAALSAAAACADPVERLQHLRRAESVMTEAQPVIPLYHSRRTYLKHRDVSGWFPLMLDNHPFDAIGIRSLHHD